MARPLYLLSYWVNHFTVLKWVSVMDNMLFAIYTVLPFQFNLWGFGFLYAFDIKALTKIYIYITCVLGNG